jgi:hypothetical protein
MRSDQSWSCFHKPSEIVELLLLWMVGYAFDGLEFDRFNKNFEALKQKVYNEGLLVEKELEDFEYQKKKFPSTGTSKQGHPLWHKHAAKHLLTKDVEDGLHYQYSPSQLRKMRYEYQEFPLVLVI